MGERGRSEDGMEVAGVCQEMTSEIWVCIIMVVGLSPLRRGKTLYQMHTGDPAFKLISASFFYQSAQLNGLIDGLGGQ